MWELCGKDVDCVRYIHERLGNTANGNDLIVAKQDENTLGGSILWGVTELSLYTQTEKMKLEVGVRQTYFVDMAGVLVSSLSSNMLYFLLTDRLSLHFFSGISYWRLGCCLLHHSPVSMSEDWCDGFRQWNWIPCGAVPVPSKLENCWFFVVLSFTS